MDSPHLLLPAEGQGTNAVTDQTTPRWDLANRWAVPGTGRHHHPMLKLGDARIQLLRAQEAHYGSRRGSGMTDGDPYAGEGITGPTLKHRSWKKYRTTQWKETG